MSHDCGQSIHEQVKQAIGERHALSIHGAGSHAFMPGEFAEAQRIDMTAHRGIIDYQPSELTLKARAGTPIDEINRTLTEQGQRLATEVPVFGEGATLGGALATGLTGSGRPFLGAVRDHVLGARLVNGHGEIIDCGGQVMKNVAGYDISRLLAGSRGILGPVLDITLKVLPRPEQQLTLVFDMAEAAAIDSMNSMAGRPLPITACAYTDGQLHVRLEGSQSGVNHAARQLGGEQRDDGDEFWAGLSNLQHDFFITGGPLWRVLTPMTAKPLHGADAMPSLIDWCGGLRWIIGDALPGHLQQTLRDIGASAECFRGGQATPEAERLSATQRKLYQRIKIAFDPHGLFNPALSRFD